MQTNTKHIDSRVLVVAALLLFGLGGALDRWGAVEPVWFIASVGLKCFGFIMVCTALVVRRKDVEAGLKDLN